MPGGVTGEARKGIPISIINNFVNLGDLGKIYLTLGRRNDKLGNSLIQVQEGR